MVKRGLFTAATKVVISNECTINILRTFKPLQYFFHILDYQWKLCGHHHVTQQSWEQEASFGIYLAFSHTKKEGESQGKKVKLAECHSVSFHGFLLALAIAHSFFSVVSYTKERTRNLFFFLCLCVAGKHLSYHKMVQTKLVFFCYNHCVGCWGETSQKDIPPILGPKHWPLITQGWQQEKKGRKKRPRGWQNKFWMYCNTFSGSGFVDGSSICIRNHKGNSRSVSGALLAKRNNPPEWKLSLETEEPKGVIVNLVSLPAISRETSASIKISIGYPF